MNTLNASPVVTVKSVVMRGFASLFVFAGYVVANAAFAPVATLVTGKIAGDQFRNDDASYLITSYTFSLFSWVGMISTFALLVILAMIWWTPGKAAIKAIGAALAAAMLLVLAAPQSAKAYYDKTDWPEIYFILPNESAFYLPDVGANKDSQAAFGSEAYLVENKIAAKRFLIPHVKLPNSSWGSDYYVPAGRLIVVDRTPYAREWTKDSARGTNAGDQSFPCQSKEGLDVTVEVSIAATVFEEQAPKFLYRFGVKPPVGDRTTKEVVFVSVYQGRSLAEVMDTVVRGKIQGLVCKELALRPLDQINAESGMIMAEAEKNVRAFMAEFGITLDYIGWGGTFTFSETVQKSLDDKFAADKIAPVLTTLQAQADIRIKEGLGKGLAEKGLPQNLIAIPENLMGFTKMFGQPQAPAR